VEIIVENRVQINKSKKKKRRRKKDTHKSTLGRFRGGCGCGGGGLRQRKVNRRKEGWEKVGLENWSFLIDFDLRISNRRQTEK
jgi:hypothetical protein